MPYTNKQILPIPLFIFSIDPLLDGFSITTRTNFDCRFGSLLGFNLVFAFRDTKGVFTFSLSLFLFVPNPKKMEDIYLQKKLKPSSGETVLGT